MRIALSSDELHIPGVMRPLHSPPHFLILGAMKAASTTLFRWLGEHPLVRLPEIKEPNFFSDTKVFRRGLDWYRGLFPSGFVSGEASVEYSNPAHVHGTILRVQRHLGSQPLIFLVRDPIARLRSHYRHEVLRGREKRPLSQATADTDSGYEACSNYARSLKPWRQAMSDSLLVLKMEELETAPSWSTVLDHIGLPQVPRPETRHNQSSNKKPFTPLMRVAYDSGLYEHARKWAPRALRTRAKGFMLGDGEEQARLIESSKAPLDPRLEERLREASLGYYTEAS